MKKTDLKIVVLTAVGVMVAGVLMAQFPDAPGVSNARDGYRA